MDFISPIIGLLGKALEKAYDGFVAAHGVRLQLEPGYVGYTDGHTEPFIMVTIYNRGRPQKVETIGLRTSKRKLVLQLPIPEKPFKPLPQVVTETENYTVGFDLDDIRKNLKQAEVNEGRRIHITGAYVRLASGRMVTLRKRIDADNDELFGGGKIWQAGVKAGPEPSQRFLNALGPQMPRAVCESTVILEAVPPSADLPADAMRDVFDGWLKSIEPGVHRESLDSDFWVWQPPDKTSATFIGRLFAGPFISVSRALDIVVRPPLSGATAPPTANLCLAPLIDWWKKMIIEGTGVMNGFGITRLRLGLIVITFGSGNEPRLIDVDFSGLPKPARQVTPSGYIDNLTYPKPPSSSKPFFVPTFPVDDMDAATRQLLRQFGYREVDELMHDLAL